MVIMVVLGFAGFGFMQISSLAKKKWWRELAVFTSLWLAGFILSSLMTLGVQIPPVTTLIGKLLMGLLGAWSVVFTYRQRDGSWRGQSKILVLSL